MTPRELLLLYLKQHRTDPHAPEKWHAAIVALFDEREADMQKLRNPATLHANLLRGQPAQLTREMLLHLLGDAATDAARAAGETT